MRKREAIQPRYYEIAEADALINATGSKNRRKATSGRFRRGQRAWRACKVSMAYLGDLAGAGQSGRSRQGVEHQACFDDLPEVGLPHSSDKTEEMPWSEGGNKSAFAQGKTYRALEARKV